MAVELRESGSHDLARADVIERVQAHIENGKTPNEAIADVYAEIELAGELEALARLHGHNLVGDIWRTWNISHRPAAVSRTVSRPAQPSLVTSNARPVAAVPPARVVDLTPLRETLDSLYKIDGRWVRLGDMDAKACIKVAEQYRTAAIADEHKSRHMRAIAAALKEGETVSQKLSEQELMRLYRITAPPGNTLA
jgi:hypothetical protein